MSAVWRPYCQMKTAPPPLQIVAAQGCELITRDGRTLIDGMASWWSACHGHKHPHVQQAVAQQLSVMPHVMFGGITHEPAERLADRLVKILPGDLNHVFFADSGSVAVEVAMKMATGYWRRHGQPNRTRFLAFENAYHGDTTGAMSLCDPERSMHASQRGAILQQIHCPLPNDEASTNHLEKLLHTHGHELAAVFLEPLIQGAGGMRFHQPETVVRIRNLCDQTGVLFIADEIATGFCRTGSTFAIDQCGNQCGNDPGQCGNDQGKVIPDIICLGKALTAGTMTMAATIARDHVFDAFWTDNIDDALMHGPTFMANPLACAAANASLDLFESEPRLEQVRLIESALKDGLEPCRNLPGVVDVRARGAVGVIQVESLPEVEFLRSQFVDAGLWLRPFGDCIYTTPPLTITPNQLNHLTETMATVTATWANRHVTTATP